MRREIRGLLEKLRNEAKMEEVDDVGENVRNLSTPLKISYNCNFNLIVVKILWKISQK
jgi:hypothetical protein